MELCIDCKKNPITVKKRGLCARCYQRLRKEHGRLFNPDSPISNLAGKHRNREIIFVQSYFESNKDWIHQPACFYLDGTKYTPDFYDKKRRVFIEVSGTRQAYEQSRRKYEMFKATYPDIKFEIRHPSGKLLDPEKPQWEQYNN